jgi:hypothetical protein
LTVELGLGAGQFAPPVPYYGVAYANAVALADVNGDGSLDLVAASPQFNGIDVLLGSGGGAFGAATSFPAGSGPAGLRVVDVNGDGALDVAVANAAANTVAILGGNGSGGFFPPAAYAVGSQPAAVDAADFDADGKLDIACACQGSNSVWVSPGVGGGVFGRAVEHTAGTGPAALAAGSFVNVGDADIVVVNSASGTLSVLAGNGLGQFTYGVDLPLHLTALGAHGDFSGDGLVDFVVTCGADKLRYVISGGGSGFVSIDVPIPGLGDPQRLEAGDFDNDGVLDVAATCIGPDHVAIVASGTGVKGITSSGNPVSAMRCADLDVDGNLDVVFVSSSADGAVKELCDAAGDGLAGLTSPPHCHGGNVRPEPGVLSVGDTTGDGKPDLFFNHFNPSLGFPAAAYVASSGPDAGPGVKLLTANFTVAFAVGDVDHDGRADLVAADVPSGLVLFLSKPNGSLGPPAPVAFPADYSDLTLGEIDGDGNPDLVALTTPPAGPIHRHLTVAVSNGAGGFAAPEAFSAGAASFATLLDADADGRQDVLTVHSGGGAATTVAVHRNRSNPVSATETYGGGTSGCLGRLGLSTNRTPALGASLTFTSTNGPPNAAGLLLVSSAIDAAGSDPLGIGATLHVELLTATEIFGLPLTSDASGAGSVTASIPGAPALAGSTYFTQAAWIEAPGARCGASPFHVVTSRGLAFTIQP